MLCGSQLENGGEGQVIQGAVVQRWVNMIEILYSETGEKTRDYGKPRGVAHRVPESV
jgi:hypothetical protein